MVDCGWSTEHFGSSLQAHPCNVRWCAIRSNAALRATAKRGNRMSFVPGALAMRPDSVRALVTRAAVIVVGFLVLGSGAVARGAQTPAVTFTKDVAPILFENCA